MANINYNLAHFVASYGKASQIPPSTCPEVSFVGRSNVGKSSIMNKLFGRKGLVKVSSTPGKTANWQASASSWNCPPSRSLSPLRRPARASTS